MAAEWYSVELPLLCLGVAAVELDAVHAGQWMLSRPLVLGPALGWVCGMPAVGISAGILLEFVTLDDLPVGSVVPLTASIAAAAAVLLAAGPRAVEPAAALPAGLVLGTVFGRVETAVRAALARLTRVAEDAVDRGRPAPFGRLVALGLGAHMAAAAVFLYAGVVVLGPALAWGWEAGPGFMRRGLAIAYAATQSLGWATLAFALRPK